MKNKLLSLCDKDDTISYHSLLELEMVNTESNELYEYFDILIDMLGNSKSYIRVRAFRLICSLALWDCDNKINDNVELILSILDDDKPTNVRQALAKINLILLYKPELSEIVSNKLNNLDLSKYKDSMRPLIEKDIMAILNTL